MRLHYIPSIYLKITLFNCFKENLIKNTLIFSEHFCGKQDKMVWNGLRTDIILRDHFSVVCLFVFVNFVSFNKN